MIAKIFITIIYFFTIIESNDSFSFYIFYKTNKEVEIIKEEFQDQNIDLNKVDGWSTKLKLKCPLTTTHEYTGEIFGPFLRPVKENTKVFSNLPPHWSASWKADVMIYGSVDSATTSDQVQLILDNQTNKAVTFTKKYYDGYQICENIQQSIDGNPFKDYYFNDLIYPFYQNISHSATNFEMRINSNFVNKLGNFLTDTEGYALKYIQFAVDTCFKTCKSCTGPSITQCTSCPKDSILKNGKCLCSSGKIAHEYQCVTDCPVGFTADNSKTYCESASCDSNCQTCQTTTKTCTACKIGYQLFEGRCIQTCPTSYTTKEGSTCKDLNVNNKETRVYALKSLFENDFTESDLIKFDFTLTGFPTSGGRVRKCDGKNILGGFMIGGKGISLKKTVTSLEPHFSLKFGFQLYLIDYWVNTNIVWGDDEGSVTILYGNTSIKEEVQRKGKPGSKMCGQTKYDDYIYNYSKEIVHTDSFFQFTIQTNINRIIYDQTLGIREIFVLIEKCPDTCTACTSENNCTSCKQGYYLQYGVCKKCPDGKYSKNNNCVDCTSECKNCISDTLCTSCPFQKPYLYENKCFIACPAGYAPDTDNSCQPCHEICQTCSQPSSDSFCLSCSGDLFLEGKQCLATCNDGQYGSNNICKQCNPICKTCINLDTECQTCPAGKVFQNKTCLDKCLDGFYSEGGICTKCNDECSKCNGPSQTNCSGCSGNTSLYQGKCISLCPDQNVSLSNECKKCYDGCNKCQGTEQNKCSECVDGYFFLDTNECLKSCPVNYFNDLKTKKCTSCFSTCSQCTSEDATSCLKCRAGNYLKDSQCKSTCPIGFYGNTTTLICDKCHDSCKGCKGPTQSECTSCNTGTFLTPSFTCSTTCPNGYFSNILTNNCDKCQLPCENCVDTATSCLSCISGFLSKKECPSTCPDGQFGNAANKKCELCTGNCKTCENTSTFCLTCKDKTYLKDNQCLETCPKGQYAEDASNSCKNCDHTCTSCVGPNQSDCRSCNDGKFYDITNGTQPCQTDCPNQYFGNNLNMQCEKCDDSCKSCTGKLNNQCKECIDNKIFHEGQCLDTCPDKYFEQNKSCQKCHDDCFNCTNSDQNQCTACIDDKYLEGSTCVKVCLITKFKNNKNNKCEVCNSCYSCIGPQTTDCLTCEGEFFLNPDRSCQKICPSHYFKHLQSNKCEECSESCAECSINAQSCDKCNSPTFLDKNKRVCVNNCPKKYFENDNKRECEQCNDSCYQCESNKDKCTSCDGSNLLTAQNTCSTTCDTGYYPDLSQNECIKCDLNCKNCEDSPKNCTECANDKFLYKSECIPACPSGFYANSNRQCQRCNDNCVTCESKDTQCTTCDISKLLYLNTITKTCTSDCPQKTFPEDSSTFCQSCHKTCLSCSNDQEDKCLSCENSYLYEGRCLKDCPEHYFPNKNSNICQKCSDKCFSCFDYMQNDCLSCYPGQFLNKKDKSCLNAVDCPLKTFPNPHTNTCDDCHSSCASCTDQNEDQCTACDNSLNFYKNKCYKDCPINTFKNGNKCEDCHSSCSQCVDQQETTCQACRNTSQVVENGKCLDQCSGDYYIEDQNASQKVCKKCSDKCSSCSGPSDSQCTSCPDPLYLHSFKCVSSCPKNLITDDTTHKCMKCAGNDVRYQNQCIPTCPPKTYEYDQECFECGANCDVCDKNGCKTCSNSYLNQKGICKTQCDQIYFQDNNDCLQCNQNCFECSGPSEKQCKNCQGNKNLHKGECLENCPQSYFKELNVCKQCDGSCLECTAQATSCTKCKPGEGLYQQQCFSQPPPHTYKDGDVFKPCHTSCDSCKGSLDTDCTSCKSSDFSIDTKCVSKCPSGYFENSQNSKCTKCLENCSTCKNADECEHCDRGSFLDGNKCISKCVELKQYQDELNQKCVNCHATCEKGCTGGTEQDCIDDGDKQIAIGESTMFKIFIGQTVIFAVLTGFGYFKDKKDEKNTKQTQVSSVSCMRKSSQDNSLPGNQEQVAVATQLKTNGDQPGRQKRQFRKKINPLFTSVGELEEKGEDKGEKTVDGDVTPKNIESQILTHKGSAHYSSQILTAQNLNDNSPYRKEQSRLISKQNLEKSQFQKSSEVLPTFSNHQEVDEIPQDESTNTDEDKNNKYNKINKKAFFFAMQVYIVSLIFLFLSQAIKVIVQRAINSVSILQRFQGAIPIIFIFVVSITNICAAFIPRVSDIFQQDDEDWAFSYLLTFFIDLCVIQVIISFAIFKVSLASLKSVSYKFKSGLEILFKQNFMLKKIQQSL